MKNMNCVSTMPEIMPEISSFMGMTSEWEMTQIEKALKCSLALDRENMNPERGNLFG